MKILKYNLCTMVNHGTEEAPDWREVLTPAEMGWTEANEAIAAKEAHNGEYSVEDDGTEETAEPTTAERLDALEAAMLEMALGGV